MRLITIALWLGLTIGSLHHAEGVAGTPLDPLICPDSNGACAPVVDVVFRPGLQCAVHAEKDLIVVLTGRRDVPITFTLHNGDPNRRASFDVKGIRILNGPSASLDLDDNPSSASAGPPPGLSPDGQSYTVISRNRRNLSFGFKIFVNDATGNIPQPCRPVDPTIANQG